MTRHPGTQVPAGPPAPFMGDLYNAVPLASISVHVAGGKGVLHAENMCRSMHIKSPHPLLEGFWCWGTRWRRPSRGRLQLTNGFSKGSNCCSALQRKTQQHPCVCMSLVVGHPSYIDYVSTASCARTIYAPSAYVLYTHLQRFRTSLFSRQ